ncbi:MAG TPA: LemA family protein [Candidatus Binatia bacterium]|nr:LemA family protein [Candidatus Binatia bacterium]
MGFLLLLAIVAAAVLWGVGTYNGLVSLKNRADEAWRQIDVQLKRRHDLVPNLVEAVRGAMEFEKSTLESVVAARSRAVAARGPAETASAEAGLSRALGEVFAVVEKYPELKSNENVLRLQEELANTENLVAFARQHYNSLVGDLNTRLEAFPGSLIARQFAFERREYFEAADEDRAVPRVSLGATPRA